MADDISVKVGIEGERDFKTALSDMNQSLKTLGTEMKLVTSQFLDNEKSQSALEAKAKVLAKTYDEQSAKVELLSNQLEAAKAKYGENSTYVQRLQQSLNLATAEMNKTGAAMRQNESDLAGLKSGYDDAGDAAEKSSERMSKAGDVIKKAGAAAAAAVAAIGAAVVALGKEVIESYSEHEQLIGGVETLFGAGGQSIEDYAKTVGKSVSEVEADYKRLQKAQSTVTKNAQKAFATAGLSANEYMETVTSFSASLIASLGGDTEEAARIADMAIIDMSDNANKMGSDIASIQNAYAGFAKGQYQLLDNLKIGYGGTKTEMERLLADAEKLPSALGRKFDLENYADVVTAIHLVQENMGIAGTTAKEAATTIAGSAAATKAAWENLVTGLGRADADVGALVKDVTDQFGTLVGNVTPIIGQFVSILPTAIKGMAQSAKSLLPTVLDAAKTLIDGALASASSLIPELAPLGTDAVKGIVQSAIDYLPEIGKAAVELVSQFAAGIGDALPELIPAAAAMVTTIVTELLGADSMGKLAEGAAGIIEGLIEGIFIALPQLLADLPKIATAILDGWKAAIKSEVKGVAEFVYDNAHQWGIDLVSGFVDGITQFPDKIVNAVKGIASTVKDFLGFSEPKLGPLSDFHTYAPDMMRNFADGIRKNKYLITDQLNSVAADMATPFTVGYPGGGGGGNIYLNVTSEIDGSVLARRTYKYNIAEAARIGGAL